MNLVERTSVLKARCSNLKNLGDKIAEASNLGTRLAELRRAAEKLPARMELIAILTKAGVPVAVQAKSAPRVRAALVRIKGRYAQAPDYASLTKGQDWAVLVRELPHVIDELEGAAADGWKTYADQQFKGDGPAAVERTLAPTQENKAALQRYRQAHIRFSALRATMPASAADIAELVRMAGELKQVNFDRNVPDAVRKFLEALQKGGAPLNLITGEVRAWIEEKGLTNSYLVVPDNR